MNDASALPMQHALTCYYRSIAAAFLDAMPSGKQISSPLFLSVSQAYETAKRRLLIVGQETHSWYGMIEDLKGTPNPVETMQLIYQKFDLGRSYHRSLFCRLTHQIQQQLAPSVPPDGFMWSNLFPCDEKKTTPTREVADTLRGFRVLPNEIAILCPHVVIFLTGPNYDYTIKDLFPSCKFDQLVSEISNRELARIGHKDLPPLTFRTYHPSNLAQQKKLHYLDMITKAIKDAWTAETNPS